MKSSVIGMAVASLFVSALCFADYPEANLKYMGYSDEVVKAINEDIGLINYAELNRARTKDEEYLSEVDSTVEQLKELAVSRSISHLEADRSAAVKRKNEEFWKDIHAKLAKEETGVVVSDETKALIKNNIQRALTREGYKIIQLDIIPLSETSKKNAVRAVVRVVKPFKTGGYKEVQSRLGNIKDICCKAATINGDCMLSEMTTFVAENPKNNYYYEKTILR